MSHCNSCDNTRDEIADILEEVDSGEIGSERPYYIQKALTIMTICKQWSDSECWRNHYK